MLKANKVWIGYNSVKDFRQPDGTIKKFGNIGWYTNLDIDKRHEDLTMYKRYSPKEYPKYDNYDAIEVSKIAEIPYDYDGVMGVPITFMDKYNPDQFEIIGGTANGLVPDELKIGDFTVYNNPIIGDKKIYQRILIRNKQQSKEDSPDTDCGK